MFKKTVLMALAMTACLTSLAWADGRIWGYINYRNCTPDARDVVCIRPVSGGGCIWTGFVQIQYGPRYNTLPNTIPPGSYYIYVIPHQGSDCIGCIPIQGFVHGTDNQQCDIESCGPDIPDPRPEPGP
jgi:hypothetical protein